MVFSVSRIYKGYFLFLSLLTGFFRVFAKVPIPLWQKQKNQKITQKMIVIAILL